MFGIVKYFKTKNGCGFIHRVSLDVSGKLKVDTLDVFIHVSNILENEGDPSDILIPGELVEFDLHQFRRGPCALRVKRLHPTILEKQEGHIKKLFDNSGYGFISSSKGDVFFHHADTTYDDPQVGEEVSYVLSCINNKYRALHIRRK